MSALIRKIPTSIPSKTALALMIALLTLSAGLIRYSDLSMPLLDFHPTRQLFGAIKARGLYYQTAPGIPEWQKQITERQVNTEAVIEPPLMESASAWLYSLYGENTGFPRAISATFWILGGLLLFLLSRNLTNSNAGALVAVAFYGLLPYGISASRSFQPDPLMISLIIGFWWAIQKWATQRGWAWALAAGLFGGLAIFTKFTAVFFVLFPAIGFLMAEGHLPKAFKNPQAWTLAILGVIPAGAYFYYGTYIDPFLAQQFGGRFFVDKWIDPFFYLKWAMVADNVIPLFIALAGALALFHFANAKNRAIYGSMLIGYVLFGFTFAHHISSHDYYSLPLIPIFSLLLGELAAGIGKRFPHLQEHFPTKAMVLVVVFLTLYTGITLVEQRALNVKLSAEVGKWSAIGDAIGHQPGVLSMTTDYGYPLEYYGLQNTSLWPSYAEIEKTQRELTRQAKGRSYFLITDFDELALQPDLLPTLTAWFPLISQTPQYILFDLAHPIKAK